MLSKSSSQLLVVYEAILVVYEAVLVVYEFLPPGVWLSLQFFNNDN